MPLKKSEMEAHQAAYHALISQACSALQHGLYPKPIELASKSWDYVDGMMQYERRYEGKEFDSLEGIDIVLKYAPLVFDFQVLDNLKELLRSQKRIDKHASDDLAARLDIARKSLRDAHRAWQILEIISNSSGGSIDSTVIAELKLLLPIIEEWERMGITISVSYGDSMVPSFCTRMDEYVRGKCSSCGVAGRARKANILQNVNCPRCHKLVSFVIVASGN